MMLQKTLLVIACLSLFACATSPPAPVIERESGAQKPTAPSNKENGSDKPGTDWRPNSYTVKKGDTLYAIGLEFGYDYKEIASVNNLSPPYAIRVGQKLNLPAAIVNTEKPVSVTENEGVVVTPIKVEPISNETKAAAPAVTPILSQPKAIREPYSLEALNQTPAKSTEIASKPSVSSDTTSSATKPSEIKAISEDTVTWIWPTNGKVVASFNEASNKGLDIAGAMGQAINAASSGKVIYSGSDLRGYGKLIIIKHNKTFLSVYAHNSKLLVKEGQIVAAGQKIAEMGNTDSNSVKLHFEIRQQGKSVDPAKFLAQN